MKEITTKSGIYTVEERYGDDLLDLIHDRLKEKEMSYRFSSQHEIHKKARDRAYEKVSLIESIIAMIDSTVKELEESTQARQQAADKEMFDNMFRKTT